jgi:mannose-6-phosphate isomerase-like protein (cupin superfamily)
MDYRVVGVDDLPSTPDRPYDRRAIGDAADLDRLAFNRDDADPGEQLPLAFHYHDEQEELFYVLSGTLRVETPDGEYTVDTDETFVAEPDSPHRAYNPEDAEAPVRVLAIGAPPVDDVHPYEP